MVDASTLDQIHSIETPHRSLAHEMTDNNELFKQPRVCLLCEETFTLGEMYIGKRYIDTMRCPYCHSYDTVALLAAPQPKQ